MQLGLPRSRRSCTAATQSSSVPLQPPWNKTNRVSQCEGLPAEAAKDPKPHFPSEPAICNKVVSQFHFLSAERARRRVLQLGVQMEPSTPGTVGHRLRPMILDMTGSLQWKPTGKPYTPYQIKPHHSSMKRRDHQPKKN
jgi:hypothetical protein